MRPWPILGVLGTGFFGIVLPVFASFGFLEWMGPGGGPMESGPTACVALTVGVLGSWMLGLAVMVYRMASTPELRLRVEGETLWIGSTAVSIGRIERLGGGNQLVQHGEEGSVYLPGLVLCTSDGHLVFSTVDVESAERAAEWIRAVVGGVDHEVTFTASSRGVRGELTNLHCLFRDGRLHFSLQGDQLAVGQHRLALTGLTEIRRSEVEVVLYSPDDEVRVQCTTASRAAALHAFLTEHVASLRAGAEHSSAELARIRDVRQVDPGDG